MSILLSRSGRLVFLVLIGLVVIIYVALGFLFIQQGPIRDNLAQQITQIETVVNKPLASIEKLRTDNARINETLALVSSQVILDKVTATARESGINIEPAAGYFTFPAAGSPRTLKVGTRNYRVIAFSGITVKGEYNQVMGFIKRLDSGQVLPNLVLKMVSIEDVETAVANADPAGLAEYNKVKTALTALMTDNALYYIPNPSFYYAGGKATNDMSLFPDTASEWTGLNNYDKTKDPQGLLYVTGEKQREESFYLWENTAYFWFEGEKLISAGNALIGSGNSLIAQGDKMWEEGDALWDKGSALGVPGETLKAEGHTLMLEGDRRRTEGKKLVEDGNRLVASGEKLQIKPGNPWVEGDNLTVKGDQLTAEGDKLLAEGERLTKEGQALWDKGYAIRAEGEKLIAEGDKLWKNGEELGAGGIGLRTEGDRLRAQGTAKVTEGNKLMAAGHALLAEGERRTEEGNNRKKEGADLIKQGSDLWEAANLLWAGSDRPWEEGDKTGYVLYQHDNKADTTKDNLVDYFAQNTTTYYYTYDKNGDLRQFDGPDIATARELKYSNVVASSAPEFQVILDVDLYTMAPAVAPKTPATPAKTPAASTTTPSTIK
jgi:hypothetical protein